MVLLLVVILGMFAPLMFHPYSALLSFFETTKLWVGFSYHRTVGALDVGSCTYDQSPRATSERMYRPMHLCNVVATVVYQIHDRNDTRIC
jgi:hypothetical protein